MNRPNCFCKPKIPPHLQSPDIEPSIQDLSAFKHLTSTLVFEPTIVGTTTKKTFRIQNESKDTQTYIAQRDPNTNPIYHVFDFKISKTNVSSGDCLECTVTYSPKVTHEKNVDYFQIVDNNLKIYKICLQGECVGPSVNISIQTLYFYNTKFKEQLTNTFEIRNTSNIPVAYEFEKNRDQQEIFKVDKLRGTLGPYRHVYITVRFDGVRTGLYCERLICKVLHHEPLTIEAIGAQAKQIDFDFLNVPLKRYPQEELKGFNYYMHDSVKTTTQKPPFSLSVNYLDFGRVEYRKNANNSRTLVTSLTNHIKEDIEVVWEPGNTIFSISPQEVLIPSGESVLYEIVFRPDIADQLYSRIFTGCVYWTDFRKTLKEVCFLDIIDVPLTVSLKVIGHSFPENKRWLPRVEIVPDIIILPPAMPMSPTYTTCMLKSSGHLPTLYKFIPPKKSNFIIKPMVGIIYEFQIIAIQLQPDLNDKKAYVERWGLELNGQSEDCITFYVKGYSEYAYINVGINNIAAFNTVHPGCQDITNVMIKNSSIHFLQYNFILDKDDPFGIDHPQGQLASNESNYLQWYFTGDVQLPEVSTIKCEVQTVQNIKVVTGVPLDAYVTVYTKCAYSQLCATPNNRDFGEIQWGSMHTTAFYLFNFGQSPIHFKLLSRNQLDITEQLNIVPTQGTVHPREKIKIIVHVKAVKTGLQEMQLMYQIRLNAISNMVVDDENGYNIFFMQFYGFYPTIQIDDISGNNFGFLFSKVVLWDMFRIDEINALLKEIQHDETKEIKIALPDYEMGDEIFFATFIIKNITNANTEIKLKRQKMCDCKPYKRLRRLSLHETVFECRHRKMLTLTLSEELIEPKHPQTLRMEVKYSEYGTTDMSYSILMSNNRKLILYVDINVLPPRVTMASKYTYSNEFKMKSVFIGESEPPAQVFPLYNNSEFEIEYEVDTTPLAQLNFDYDFNIFECINPKESIPPFSSKQLLFKFVPIEVKTYNVTVPLKMGENLVQLKISGEGVLHYDSHMSEMATTMPCSSKGMYMENSIELSIDHLVIEPFPIWSTVEKLIFIRNQTSDRIIGYSWQPSIVEGTVKAEAIYRKGILQPKESHAVIIQITSFDQPCRLRLQMACKLLDHTQHIMHAQSVVAYHLKQQELRGQFTITEDDTTYPKNDVILLPDSELLFVTLAISLCVTSISDNDLCMNTEKQMKQSPQYSLHLNMANIFTNYFKSLIPTKSQLYLPTIRNLDKTTEQRNPNAQKECCRVNLKKNDIKMFKTMVERLIADVVFSDLFCKVTDTTSNSAQPYYIQFTMDDQSNTDCTREEIANNEQKLLEERMELVEDFLNKPQAPFLADIFKELIAESIHEVFQLGPQVKNRPPKPDIYHTKKTQVVCPICKCNQ